ncbi:MAG: class I SAM-dependent methyltransferase [Solirubrobacteraceae bacterium]
MNVAGTRQEFAPVLASVAGVEGWMTDAQARRLWEGARRIGPGGQIVEIGSFRGRSTIVLASAAAGGVAVVAIDPHGGGDRGPNEITSDAQRGDADHDTFHANLRTAGVEDRVRHVRRPSGDALAEVQGAIDLLYIDGAHRYRFARPDIELWGARVTPGGTMLIHDSYSAVGVMLAQLRLLFAGGRFRYVGRSGSLAEYRRQELGPRERLGNAMRQAAALPYFARNCVVKAALAARLRPVARLLGERGHWPY